MRAIESSICTVCLDAPMPRVSHDVYSSRVAAQMLHGGGSHLNSGNRWFDKTLQVSVACTKASSWIPEPSCREVLLLPREWRKGSAGAVAVGCCGSPDSHCEPFLLPQGLELLLLPLPTLPWQQLPVLLADGASARGECSLGWGVLLGGLRRVLLGGLLQAGPFCLLAAS